jgi:hypothetical protein
VLTAMSMRAGNVVARGGGCGHAISGGRADDNDDNGLDFHPPACRWLQ